MATSQLAGFLPEAIPVLMVDDDESVMQVSRLVLRSYRFQGKPLELLECNSAAAARAMLLERDDIALVLLDVVMESDDAGLQLVGFIREELQNHRIRIVLRTGQPGFAPEREVIDQYEINDYLSKADATAQRLRVVLTTALRGYRDIVAAQMMAHKAEQAGKASVAKSRFLAHMSHEIRTPLNGLIGIISLLQQTQLSLEQKDLVQDAQYAADAVLAIINDVLDLGKIEAGKLELSPHCFQANDLLRRVQSVFFANSRKKQLQLDCSLIPDDCPPLLADADRLQQILLNFVSNALKFTPDGGAIAIRGEFNAEALWLRFEVEDSGIGIAPDQLERLFLPYEQASAQVAGQFGGTGLGLSLCRSLAELMGGQVWASSVEGQGSCFAVQVPVEVAIIEDKPGAGFEETSLQGLVVAICEDDDTSRTVLERMLQRQGVELLSYEHGQALLDDAQWQRADILLLDCNMPVLDGFATTEALRQLGCRRPIVALTAGVSDDERQQCHRSGFDDIVAKPVRWPELFALMQALASAGSH
ncbi:hypothetical protein GCM10011297_11950 [Bacterioplanes sanyensis]|uniref:response regulator n=1 Tax=Bacterioplanes sanyensis TaxID=1249553 RepID=UPI001675AA1E|nr:response regulator [Bacterioplanes sanyensis]GGY40641.1 hypothetical protein GCM10011297_11950 [Bacterioplanes sanyensis]